MTKVRFSLSKMQNNTNFADKMRFDAYKHVDYNAHQ